MSEEAVIDGIGRIKRIIRVELSVALNTACEPQLLRFSSTWTCPRTVLHLSAGQLDVRNITFLVPGNGLTCEELLIRLAVLRHLKIDIKALL